MAQPSHRQEGVEQVGVTHQHRIEERRLIHRGPAAADEGRRGPPAELSGVLADRRDELTVERPDRAGDAVEHVVFQQFTCPPGQVRRLGRDDEAGQFFHDILMRQGLAFRQDATARRYSAADRPRLVGEFLPDDLDLVRAQRAQPDAGPPSGPLGAIVEDRSGDRHDGLFAPTGIVVGEEPDGGEFDQQLIEDLCAPTSAPGSRPTSRLRGRPGPTPVSSSRRRSRARAYVPAPVRGDGCGRRRHRRRAESRLAAPPRHPKRPTRPRTAVRTGCDRRGLRTAASLLAPEKR